MKGADLNTIKNKTAAHAKTSASSAKYTECELVFVISGALNLELLVHFLLKNYSGEPTGILLLKPIFCAVRSLILHEQPKSARINRNL